MKTSQLQASKARNANTITILHSHVAARRATAKVLFEAARFELREAARSTDKIKSLARQQVTIKRDLKGPAKAKREAKVDTRPAAHPKVGAAFQPIVVGVTGGTVSVANS